MLFPQAKYGSASGFEACCLFHCILTPPPPLHASLAPNLPLSLRRGEEEAENAQHSTGLQL